MADQTIIQVRVDSELKEQTARVFEEIGIDIPTAVRMFFKAAVRAQGLPFSTALSTPPPQDGGMTIAGRTFTADEVNAFQDWAKGTVMYEAPEEIDDETVVVLPLEYGKDISPAMYAQLVSKVPAGYVTCWEDIYDFLGKIYNRTVQGQPDRPLPRIDSDSNPIPYWRIVTNRGVLGEYYAGSRERQKEQLIQESVPVIQRGTIEGSYKVEDYKNHMFNFGLLKIVKR